MNMDVPGVGRQPREGQRDVVVDLTYLLDGARVLELGRGPALHPEDHHVLPAHAHGRGALM